MTENVARLICLGRAVSDLTLPVKLAGRMVRERDLAAFVGGVEEHVRALVDRFESYLAGHPDRLERLDRDGESGLVIKIQLDGVRKELARLSKIGHGKMQLDIGPEYLPLDK